MLIKYLRLTMAQNNLLIIILLSLFLSCTYKKNKAQDGLRDNVPADYFTKTHYATCTPNSKPEQYKVGDLPCTRNEIVISSIEKLVIKFIITNKNSEDPYEYGYKELQRYLNGKVVEKIKLRRDGEPVWSFAPFVRIRNQTYLADLDDDGYLEFAVFPFSPGSAIWGTVRIFSLKEKIEFWGEGRYQFEGDTFVQLGCMRCSKFNPEECKKCH